MGDYLTLEFDIIGDGLFHTYYVPLYSFREPIPVVQHQITQLRLEPALQAALGQSLAIDFIRIAEGTCGPLGRAALIGRTLTVVSTACCLLPVCVRVWCVHAQLPPSWRSRAAASSRRRLRGQACTRLQSESSGFGHRGPWTSGSRCSTSHR